MGAFSPSKNKFYNTQVLQPTTLELLPESENMVRFGWDWDSADNTIGIFKISDYIKYDNSTPPVEQPSDNQYKGYCNYPISNFDNTSDPDYGFYNCRGGINVTILNQGVFIKAEPNSYNMINPCMPGTNTQSWYDSPSQDDTGGDTLEWFKGISNRGDIYDAISVGLNWGLDFHDYYISGITCDTIIKVELPHSYSGLDNNGIPDPTDYTQASGRCVTELEFGSNILDKFGETASTFFLWHPMTNQIIWDMDGEFDFNLDNIPEDLLFFGSSALCPMQIPTNDIMIYKYGGYDNTQGELQVVIFFDKTMAGRGYHFGGTNNNIDIYANSIEYIHFASMVNHAMTGLPKKISFNGVVEYNEEYIYSVGGTNNDNGNVNDIVKYTIASNTADIMPLNLNTPKSQFATGYSNIAGYFMGGVNTRFNNSTPVYVESNNKLSFADETMSTVSHIPFNCMGMGSSSNKQISNLIYYSGGKTEMAGITDSINIFNTVTETFNTNAYFMSTPTQRHTAKMTKTMLYMIGGDNDNDTFNSTTKLDLSNGTISAGAYIMTPSTITISSLYCKENDSILLNGTGCNLDYTENPLQKTYEKYDCTTDNTTVYLTQRIAPVGNPTGSIE